MRPGTPASFDGAAVSAQRTAGSDPYKWDAIGMALLFALTLPLIVTLIALLQPDPASLAAAGQAGGGTGVTGVSPVALGRSTYAASCAVCHGPNGDGVHSLGKPLHNSAFIQEQADEQLFALIVDGRKPGAPGNTTGALMPGRGARNLKDGHINAVIAYLRTLQEPGVPPVSMEPWNIVGREGAGGQPIGAIEMKSHAGYELFLASCAACHGKGAEGIEGLGLPLTTSGYVRGTGDADLVRFVKSGRASWDANNSTGIDMPPKGGNPAITDDQLQTIVEYIRAVQKEAMGS
ncbi:MAG: hypothetical protein C0475_04390 [Planctomyces sp.]|nr:hypothetical protein [Planctomyces sp.]